MTVLILNNTLQSILLEVESLDSIEQKAILAYIKAKKLLFSKKKPLNPSHRKALSLKEIDAIKHKSSQ